MFPAGKNPEILVKISKEAEKLSAETFSIIIFMFHDFYRWSACYPPTIKNFSIHIF